jgi:flagellar basal-body rod modification protein FlgD
MSQIAGFSPVNEALQSSTPSRFNEMESEDFIRIIFTELSNQDPFQPNDSAALLEQLDSIRSIESDLQLTEQLNALVTQNQLAAAANMIGKFVSGLTADADRVEGRVVSVSRQGDTINVELDNGWVLPIDGIESIIDTTGAPNAQGGIATT